MINNAKEHGDLYYFEDGQSLSTFVTNSFFGFHSNCQDIKLWNFQLGHPSFHYLRKLFPTIFVNKDPPSLNYEFWAKHHRKSYPSKFYQPSKYFHLIHNDI